MPQDEGMQQRAPEGQGDTVRTIFDVPFCRVGEHTLTMDLLLPTQAQEAPVPAVLWLHGGGWYSGNKRNAIVAGMLDGLVAAGYAVSSVEYRLSSEALFPAQIHDVWAALRHLAGTGAAYGIDATRIGIAGFSAGAHLAALAAAGAGDARLDPDSETKGPLPRLGAAIILAAPTDFARNPRAIDPALNPHQAAGHPCAEHLLLGGPVLDHLALAELANPLGYVGPATPPCLIVHGREDEIVPLNQAELLFSTLHEAGTAATLVVVEDGNHGFWEAGQPYPPEPLPPRIQHWIIQFLETHLRGRAAFPLSGRHTVRVADLRV